MSCKHCDSDNISSGIKVSQTADVGSIGLEFRRSILAATEQLYCDLCEDCGTVNRIFVKKTNRKWLK